MTQTKRTTIHESFTALEDPRQEGKVEHPLVNVIFLTICGVLCGADNWTEIESFGYAQREWLGTYLDLTHGIPAHDTLGRVFSQLDGASFSDCFVVWMSSLAEQQGKQIAIDGKVCLLYTSDAADERSSVDLGGRRIIKKKKNGKTGWGQRIEKNIK